MNTNHPTPLPPLFDAQTTVREWTQHRRNEILALFQNEVFGKFPEDVTLDINTRVADIHHSESIMGGNAIRKTIEITAKRNGLHFSFPVIIFIPANASKPVPAIITLCNRGLKDADPARHFMSAFWPAETIVARGFAAIAVLTHDIAPDYDEGFTMGVHKLFPEYTKNRPENAWGAITAWAWGLSRIMDYLETDSLIDCHRVAVVGHSRGGKTALWCAAQDSRFAMAVSSSSGCSGAALSRNNTGEQIRDITTRFPYWFCRNYQKYNNNVNALPIDQHMLLALIAPRLIYISSKTFDHWADPASEFEACVQASPAYHLFGKVGMPATEQPHPEHPIHTGEIGYHFKTGIHDMDEYDWERYLDFATMHL